jgi:hypothetical protein
MVRTRRTFAAIMLVVAIALTLRPVQSAVISGSTFRYHKWLGEAYTDNKTGGFSNCSVASAYVSGKPRKRFHVHRQGTGDLRPSS